MEEVGSTIRPTIPVGIIEEYIKEKEIKNITYVMITDALTKGAPIFTGEEDEKELAGKVEWIKPAELTLALQALIDKAAPSASSRLQRDLLILRQLDN